MMSASPRATPLISGMVSPGNAVHLAAEAVADDAAGDGGVELGGTVVEVGEDDRPVDLALGHPGILGHGGRRDEDADGEGDGMAKHELVLLLWTK